MESVSLQGKTVAILGFGVEGRSSYSYFVDRGADVTIVDNSTKIIDLPAGAQTILGPDSLDSITDFDIVCRTPSMRPDRIKTKGVVTSLSSEFFTHCPAPIIGVTGTKGKGTTTTLIAKILEEAGKKVHIVGNIGIPALDVLDDIKPDDIVCYELSSFQLWDMTRSPHVAVVLMIEADHQDVHSSIDEYVEAKSNIARYQGENDVIIVHPENGRSQYIADYSSAKKYEYLRDSGAYIKGEDIVIDEQYLCSVHEVGLIGVHNLENICAAITAAWQYTQDIQAIAEAVKSFTGLEHRLELVRECEGVSYFNDSYSATPVAARAAANVFGEKGIMIFGGKDKGVEYCSIARAALEAKSKFVILIGEIAPKLEACFQDIGFDTYERIEGDMVDAVRLAKEKAVAGDSVVLSPGTSSFDMFANYKARGQAFRDAAGGL